ncbi:MAG: energy transducer TonB [Gammaproteobacteria bacterium]|nr:energy transducer TonB [Gammaproteobacteria bacterium]
MQRFIIGFIAAIFVSLGIFGLAQSLIRTGHAATCTDCPTVVQLQAVFRGKPPEEKPREKEPPEKPSEPQKPEMPAIAQPPTPRVPPALDRSLLSVPGAGVAITGVDINGAGGSSGLAVLHRVEPQYPAHAMRKGIEGEVEVEFTVQPDGSVTDIRIISASPRGVFEQAVRRAVARWGFQPRQADGRAAATRVRQVLLFRLPDSG